MGSQGEKVEGHLEGESKTCMMMMKKKTIWTGRGLAKEEAGQFKNKRSQMMIAMIPLICLKGE
jgi:hypothetical protein